MKENILLFIENSHPAYDEVIHHFCDVSPEMLTSLLNEMEEDGLIDKLKNRYYLTKELNMVPAVITSIKEKFSFATVSEDEDVYIDNSNLKNAFLNDKVLLKKVTPGSKGKNDEFEVIKITKRANEYLVGDVHVLKGIKILYIEKIAEPGYLFLIKENEIHVERNQVIRAKVTKITSKSAVVEPVEIIGNKTDVGVDVARIILANGAPLEFPEEVKKQASEMPLNVPEDDLKAREDFRDHLIVTIDGEDAKDFDDAVEVTKIDDIYYIGVHIADVSHYVKEGSPMDKEALSRSCSLYVRDRVVPMLPFELSNGICSLNPDVDRLVLSCLFSIDKQGNILTKHITQGVIHSHARLTYTYVNKFLNEERYTRKEYTDLEKMLINLEEAASIIRKKRQKHGAIELSSTELQFVIGEDGVPLSVSKKVQDVGEKLIEDMMIAANEVIASSIEEMKLPMVYRIHSHPKAKKMESYMRLSAAKGYPASFDPLTCTPLDIAEYLDKITDKDDKEVLSSLLLRCLAKAKYSVKNEKHFGLASSSYTHFTSPIRRYPDLIVHRLVRRYIINKNTSTSDEFNAELVQECMLTSTRERRALSVERSVEALLSAKYMKKHIGEEYEAKIVSMITNGMFVEIPNGIQGFLGFESIPGDYYVFDESTYHAYGVRKGKRFALGDKVRVIVTNVDTEHSQISFAIMSQMKLNKGRYGRRTGH